MTKDELIKDLEKRGFSKAVTNITLIEIQWLYENGYEVIKKESETIENRTRRIHSNATEEEIQKLIQEAKDFKPSNGVEWIRLR